MITSLPKALAARRRQLDAAEEPQRQQAQPAERSARAPVRLGQFSDLLTYKDTNDIKRAIKGFDVMKSIDDFAPEENKESLKNLFKNQAGINEFFVCLLDESYATLTLAQGYGFDTNRLPIHFESRSEILSHFSDNAERVVSRKMKDSLNNSVLKSIPEGPLKDISGILSGFLINKAAAIGHGNNGWAASVAANTGAEQSALPGH